MHYIINKLSLKFPLAASYVKRFHGEGLSAVFAKGASGAFVINVLGMGVAFGLHLLLTHLMNTESYGNFVYSITWLHILALTSKVGIDKAAVRFVPEYKGLEQWGKLRGFLIRSTHTVVATSLFSLLIMALFVYMMHASLAQELYYTLLVACPILLLESLLITNAAKLRGLKKVSKSLTLQMLLRPGLFALIILLFYFIINKKDIDAPTAIIANITSFIIVLLISYWLLQRTLPQEAKQAKPQYLTGHWIRVAIPMLVISIFFQVEHQADIIVAGFFLESSDIAIYSVARRCTAFIILGLASVNAMVAPLISELYAQGNKVQLQRIVRLAARGTFAFTMPVGILMIIFGKYLLYLFGIEFIDGYTALVICSIGQMADALTGSVAFLMIMTGHQKQASIIIGTVTLISIILNAILTPYWGIEGAAIATALSVILRNMGLLIYVLKVIKINPTVFS